METLTTTIEWHLAEKELPKKSGEYLTVTPSGTIMNTHFSFKHKQFCNHDYMEKDANPYQCVFWAEIPDCFSWEALAPYREEE